MTKEQWDKIKPEKKTYLQSQGSFTKYQDLDTTTIPQLFSAEQLEYKGGKLKVKKYSENVILEDTELESYIKFINALKVD